MHSRARAPARDAAPARYAARPRTGRRPHGLGRLDDRAALIGRAESEIGKTERAFIDAEFEVVAGGLERHRAFRRGPVADQHQRVADGAEIERPAGRGRELAHRWYGRVDEMIDEADTCGEREHAVGDPIADAARHLGHVAERDQGLEQPRRGRFRQGCRLCERGQCRGPMAVERLQHGEGALDRFDGCGRGERHGGSVFRNTEFVDLAPARCKAAC